MLIEHQDNVREKGGAAAVFRVFLKLGMTSFGGPIAHIGYFRAEFVQRRQWLSEEQFAQLLAICQFLPGPASSQLGFCVGLARAGWLGALAAFIAFTLPSVFILVAFALLLPLFTGDVIQAVIHGLKLVAFAVVADAVLGMARKLCPDLRRRSIAIAAAAVVLLSGSATVQIIVVLFGAIAGLLLRTGAMSNTWVPLPVLPGPRLGGGLLLLFFVLLFVLPSFASTEISVIAVAEAFYRAGALVFGGGHVVLPLLQESVVGSGWLSQDQFLAGYGASQAIPGPLFAFSAYLGALLAPAPLGYLMAMVALVFMFLPGFLLVAGVLPLWQAISHNPKANHAIAGVNAAVVGLLAAALYQPIFTSGIASAVDLVVGVLGFALLAVWRLSPLWVVLWCVTASLFINVIV